MGTGENFSWRVLVFLLFPIIFASLAEAQRHRYDHYTACTPHEFRCRNHQCIDNRLRCNGIAECHDKSDELNCPCKDNEFECAAGYCISIHRRCDGVNDCSNKRDEENCPIHKYCRSDEFDCGGGQCINGTARCDGRNDCPDNTDETNCSVTTCSSDQFRCLDGSCVGIDKRCNGYSDCRNGEDENQCGCGAGEFRCSDGQCIANNLQCNGFNDCQDGSDERDCEYIIQGNHKTVYKTDIKITNDSTTDRKKYRKQRRKKPKPTPKKLPPNLPESGNYIENPLLEAFPQLYNPKEDAESSPKEKGKQSIKARVEFNSYNSSIRNDSNHLEEFHATNLIEKIKPKVNKGKTSDLQSKILDAQNYMEYLKDQMDKRARKQKISTKNSRNIKNNILMDKVKWERIIAKLQPNGAIYSYLQKQNLIKLPETSSKLIDGTSFTSTISKADDNALTNDPDKPDQSNGDGKLQSFDDWKDKLNNSRKDWNEFATKFKDLNKSIIDEPEKISVFTEHDDKYKPKQFGVLPSTMDPNDKIPAIPDGTNTSITDRLTDSIGDKNITSELDNFLLDSVTIKQRNDNSINDPDLNNQPEQITSKSQESLTLLDRTNGTQNRSRITNIDSNCTDGLSNTVKCGMTPQPQSIKSKSTVSPSKSTKKRRPKIDDYISHYNLTMKSKTPKKVLVEFKKSEIESSNVGEEKLQEKLGYNSIDKPVESLRYQSNDNTSVNVSPSVQVILPPLHPAVPNCTNNCDYWRDKYANLYNKTRININERVDSGLLDSDELSNNATVKPSSKTKLLDSGEEAIDETQRKNNKKPQKKVKGNGKKHQNPSHKSNNRDKNKNSHKDRKQKNKKNKINSEKNTNGGRKKKQSTIPPYSPTVSTNSPNDPSAFRTRVPYSTVPITSQQVFSKSPSASSYSSPESTSTTMKSIPVTKCGFWEIWCIEPTNPNAESTESPKIKTNRTTTELKFVESTSDLAVPDCNSTSGCTDYKFDATEPSNRLKFTQIVDGEVDITSAIPTSEESSTVESFSPSFGSPAEYSAFESKETYEIISPNILSTTDQSGKKLVEVPLPETSEEIMNILPTTQSNSIIKTLGASSWHILGSDEYEDPESNEIGGSTTEDPDYGPCNEDQHFCDGTKCLEEEQICNEINECLDLSDEEDCDYFNSLRTELINNQLSNSTGTSTTSTSFTTVVNSKIISRCDPSIEFTCLNGSCIPERHVCDGFQDCRDGEDEDENECEYYEDTGYAPCPPMEYTCGDGSCIPKEYECDGIDNCPRAEDELNCDRACTPTQFKCATGGKCIEEVYRCDGHSDCPDRSDEINCRHKGAKNNTVDSGSHTNGSSWVTERPVECNPSYEMRCGDGKCIPLSLKCDSIPDCDDYSDERDCGKCEINEWRCASGQCIPEIYRCDGKVQCRDGSDEEICVNECPSGMFRCNDGICLDEHRRCDGEPHCNDGSDEINCQTTYCPDGQAACANGICIPKQFFCDRNQDCLDGSDEKDCPGVTPPYPPPSECRANEYTCHDRTCIPQSAVCDGRQDCSRNEDELDCRRGIDDTWHKSTPIIWNTSVSMTDTVDYHDQFGVDYHGTTKLNGSRNCTPTDFKCADGNCIPAAHRCDNFYDCRDFTDEQYCFGCARGQFQCGTGDCVEEHQRCNGVYDCSDGADEDGCVESTTVQQAGDRRCPPGKFTCRTDRICVHDSSRCNGIPECRDGSDEEGCDTNETDGLKLTTYPSEQIIKETSVRQGREVVFQCRDEGPLRAPVRWTRGNNLPLPPGSRDINGRLEIPNIQMEHAGIYMCEAIGFPPSTPNRVITVHLQVEKFEPPATRPPQVCKYNEATCSNGDCIPKSLVCDNKFDCTDGSDEMRCNPHGCEPNQYRCKSKECVLKIWRCDGDKDCTDGSDEENCGTPSPGSVCRSDEFQCHKYDQCIPKSYHCDMERDCQDGSDEIGCSPVYIVKPPQPMIVLSPGDTMILSCTAIGVPTPEINWRLNWGHIPEKCYSTSTNGTGTLTCPDISISDQGAYSCEAINTAGFVFAIPDCILIVKDRPTVCPRGTFNSQARTPQDCIPCFCFGVVDECRSANLFTYQIPPPFDRHRALTFDVEALRITGELGSQIAEIRPQGRDGVEISIQHFESVGTNLRSGYEVPYFALPEAYLGPQLLSYGGYLRYNVRYSGNGRDNSAPSVIMTGNNRTLIHRGRNIQPDKESEESVRFFYGDWHRMERGREIPASREDIMMVLSHIDNILIKAKYESSPQLDVSITDIAMDSAHDTGSEIASFVEECSCPSGYSGHSCQSCAPGFLRRSGGLWLGECYRDEPSCPPGYYGDPSRNIECKLCPCPLTNPANQFTRTCRLGPNMRPICECPAGYDGERCEKCADGYHGNPLIPGDMCVLDSVCDPRGSLSATADVSGKCRCKQSATGLTCDQCKPNTFNLAVSNQFGCISCFCMGITNRCSESNWYRNEIHVSFTNSIRDFSLIESLLPDAPQISTGIHLDPTRREIIYSDFQNRGNGDVYYWQLPSIFLGDRVTSYGGNLRYTVRYVPSPGGQSSRNNAADVVLVSFNDINLLYYSRESPEPNSNQSFSVPLLEQFWQRTDGTQADREHLLMALADIKAIKIKATYTTHTSEAALSHVSLDSAEKYNTGKAKAVEVEECNCPRNYTGLSCEDCAPGYTRADEALYLGICKLCECNGHSTQCDPETGVCENCGNHTTGENCNQCEPGYIGDPTREGCRYGGQPTQSCNCNPAGSVSNQCINGRCECKLNVEGANCNRCRPATFGLTEDNPNGCNQCFCSGVTDQCHESSLYIQQIPSWVYDTKHGFILTDASRRDIIDDGFDINVAMNEIGYQYNRATRNRRLFWSLPATFTGNKIKSYGGNLTLTQRFRAEAGAQSIVDQDVMLLGNGISLFWTNSRSLYPDNHITYSVPLRESEWRRLSPEGPRRPSRTDMMTVLSNLEAILVRATYSEGMISTYISDISLDTAVEHFTGKNRATQIESCRCPLGYIGTSCESCSRGYYRDFTDRSVSVLGACNACPCNDHEESCEMSRGGQIKCHCLSGYTGYFCQDIAELRVGLMPMHAEAPRNTEIDMKCSYSHGQKLYIYFKLSSYNGLPLTTWAMEGGPLVETDSGAYKIWTVHVGEHPCIVECTILDQHGNELAMITTTVSPVDNPATTMRPDPTGNEPQPPRISVSIQEDKLQIVHVGSTVKYHCTGRSLDNNQVHIRWEKEGGRLPDRSLDDSHGLLIIRDVKVSDSGVYICQVTDGIHIADQRVTLTVGGANRLEPQVHIRPAYREIREGEPVEFHCEASGNPPPLIEWVRVQGQMNPEATFHNGVWRIPAVTKNDAAEYKCIARNELGVKEQTTILYVLKNPNEPPPDRYPDVGPVITPQEWTGVSGDAIRMVCTRSNYHADVHWTRSGGLPLPPSASQTDGVLTITNPGVADSGTYICVALSLQGTETSTSSRITISPRRNPPMMKVEPEKQTVSQGTIAELKCLINDQNSDIEVKWSKHGESSLGPRAQQYGNTLKIIRPQVSDRGIYICRATNSAGVFEASAIIEVSPREVPALDIYPHNIQPVNLGGSADLQCRVTAGFPVPEVHWSRQDGRPFGSNIVSLPGGLLRFTNITMNDGGSYQCTASNAVGSTSALAQIEVQSIPVIRVSPNTGIIRVRQNERVKLVCTAEGHPQPNVAWTKNTPGYPSYTSFKSPHRATPLSAVHEIVAMSPDDEGSYTCQAVNAAGVSEERVQVRIEDEDNSIDNYPPCRGDQPCNRTPRPYPIESQEKGRGKGVSIPEDYVRIPMGGKVEMRCQVVGPDDSPIYLDWIRSDRRALPAGSTVHEGVLVIPDVRRDAAGEYLCLGLDRDNTELFRATSHLEVVSLPRIELNPSTQTVAPGESPSIVCTATGDQPLRIQWSSIGRQLPSSVTDDNGVLSFHGITFNDAGKYVCKASNSAGTAEAVAEVLVNAETYGEPGIRAIERNVDAVTGSSIKLRCDTRERVAIGWMREGQALPRNAVIQNNQLRLERVRPEDSGRYICQVTNSRGGVSSDYVNVHVSPPAGPVVHIEPSGDIVNIGDTFNLRCVFSSGQTGTPTYRWYRAEDGSLPATAQVYDDKLRIVNVQMTDSGVYKCRVDTAEGSFEQNYNLIVQGGENDEPAIEMKSVPYGSSIEMGCKVDFDGPITYKWSKLNGLLPAVLIHDKKMTLIKVRAEDAGTYICTASNGPETTEVPTVLVVTGVVPNFNQAPLSYIALRPLHGSYRKHNIEVSFKPESDNGIILYNAESSNGSGDFVILSLNDGVPEFRFDLGSGPAIINARRPISLGEWHTIKLQRNNKEGLMLVDGEGPYKRAAGGRKQTLDVKEPLYIGGVPDQVVLHSNTGAKGIGFVGCISRLVINEQTIDLIGNQTDSFGVTTCETCLENPCHNSGVCQEAPTKEGYTCLCRPGYTGAQCDFNGQPCYPGACGRGTCVDTENSFKCHCPQGTYGSRCEHFGHVEQPAFRNSRSFLAYHAPSEKSKRLTLSMNFNPSDNGDELLVYCSETDEGVGDFIAVVIKDRHVELRFDVGSGMVVVRSNYIIQPGSWTRIEIHRDLKDGKLSVNGEVIIEGKSTGTARLMSLNTPLYIGGVNRTRIRINKHVDVTRHFHGCINQLEISGKLHLLNSTIDSANIENCEISAIPWNHSSSPFPIVPVFRHETPLTPVIYQMTSVTPPPYNPCDEEPCKHGACQISNSYDGYSCICEYGYVGINCENVLRQCEMLKPCKNGGTCLEMHGTYKCDCPLRFSGTNCEKQVKIAYDVAFRGDGWLELERTVMTHEEDRELMGFEISTNKTNGLIMWHGQPPDDLNPDDYIALGIIDGYIEYQYNLGSGPAVIRVTTQRVDDGERHRIILKRQGTDGSIELNGEHTESGVSDGIQRILNARGNVYLGGVPDYAMTYGRYYSGFSGCIYTLEVQDSGAIDIGEMAVRGKNVFPCTRVRWNPSSLVFTDGDMDGFDAFIPPPPVNIIHPKPTVNIASYNPTNLYIPIIIPLTCVIINAAATITLGNCF